MNKRERKYIEILTERIERAYADPQYKNSKDEIIIEIIVELKKFLSNRIKENDLR
jgi:hypothetical protein|tara:strand:+ start:7290 stop:7454 length:165 start_codon:yes stop_codon:yes gene_type:complete